MWSIRSCETGRVIAHAERVVLKNAEFKVSQKGRERVLREGQKNIHAGVEGELVVDHNEAQTIAQDITVGENKFRYDPYEANYFFKVADNTPLLAPCSAAYLG